METLLIGLFLFAIVLVILSFFIKSPYKELREELDQFSMQQLQEVYQLKKKLKVLEEELSVPDLDSTPPVTLHSPEEKTDIHDIIKNQVWSLSKQGIPVEQIAEQSSLTVNEVKTILMEFAFNGKHN